MTDTMRYTLFSHALEYVDQDVYISDLSLSSIWGDDPDSDIPAERIALLSRIWDAAHISIICIRNSTGLSQKAFGRRYLIPLRTVQNWESGMNKCPLYTRLLLAKAVGLIGADIL